MQVNGDSYRPADGPANDLPLASRLTFPNRDNRDRGPPGNSSITRDSDLYRPDPDRPLPPRRTSPPPANFPHLRHDGPPRRGPGPPEPFYPDRRDDARGGPRGMRDDPRGPLPPRDERPLMDRLGGRGQTARTFAEPMSDQARRFDQVSDLDCYTVDLADKKRIRPRSPGPGPGSRPRSPGPIRPRSRSPPPQRSLAARMSRPAPDDRDRRY
jgi:hypothetical protein